MDNASRQTAGGFLSGARSLEGQFEAVGRRPSGFDYMRLILAVAVVGLHSVIVSYGQLTEIAVWTSPARPLARIVLPMFFALSGFLVAGSLIRCKTLGLFLGLRIIRIFPALSVEVTLSALILGPIFTTLALGQYFSHPEFHVYFWNVVGHIHYELPGVFEDNPFPGIVNGQLWTVPYELYCYVTLALLSLLGAVRNRYIPIVGSVVVTIAYFGFKLARDGGVPPYTTGPVPGAVLVLCFLAGVTAYQFKKDIPHHPVLGVISAALSAVLLTFVPYGEYLAPLPLAYLTVYLGLLNPPRSKVVQGADYSYGLFLYGYPIQQSLAALGDFWRHWPTNFLGTLLLGIVFAAFSWHLIEKPALRLRKPLQRAEERWLQFRGRSAENA